MNWTDERVTELRGHYDAGTSVRDIARKMDVVSPGSIIGKLHRLGLKRGKPKARPDAKRKRPPAAGRARFVAPYVGEPSMPIPEPVAVYGPFKPCDLMELNNTKCRWIVSGDGPPYEFCGTGGCDVDGGVPYCTAHARIAYQPRRERVAEPSHAV